MQMPYSTAERVGSAALVAVGVPTVTNRGRSDAESHGFESLSYLECLGLFSNPTLEILLHPEKQAFTRCN
jgi:hypothetical protein